MSGRAVVVEINEIPLRVVSDVAAEGRAPFLRSLLDDGLLVQTRIDEQMDRELYPSQTWASVGTGVPYDQHRVWWYNDPKPAEFPFYWQVAARHRSVGLVNVLHSSPLQQQCSDGDYRFVVPDCFAPDPATVPDRFEAFQRLNLELTERNSRQTRVQIDLEQVRSVAAAVRHLPLRASTVGRLTRMVAEVAAGRIPRERIRSGQFMVLSDVFLRLLDDEAPDLAVFFTNHVAAAMHRYWYARYPHDFDAQHYDDEWVARHRDEIAAAVELTDVFLRDLAGWCRLNDRALIIMSSMGQGPSQRLDSGRSLEAVVRDPDTFVGGLGIAGPWEVLGSMTPNLTVRFPSDQAAAAAGEQLEQLVAGRQGGRVDQSGNVVTCTYDLDVVDEDTILVGTSVVAAKDIGVEVLEVDDHSSGRHTPFGVLGAFNSDSFDVSGVDEIDVFEIGPAVLELLGVDRADHHRSPRFSL